MPLDLDNMLVVGISSRALFSLEDEDRIFREQGLQAFVHHQRANEDVLLRPGSAFPLVKGLLGLNHAKDRKVEVVLMSRNHPDISLRVFNSIHKYGLDISRAALTGGAPIGSYLEPFNVDLFLSQDANDVQAAANQGVAAGLIYSPPAGLQEVAGPIRIAFDGDCVIFSDEAQRVFEKGGLEAFRRYEEENARRELPAGPFAKLLRTLSRIQGDDPSRSPVRIALFTDRNMPAHERVIRTLRAWNVRIDEAFFLGGLSKSPFIKAFGAHMFFDDKEEYCSRAAGEVPTARVLLPIREEVELTVRVEVDATSADENRFLLICETYLKLEYPGESDELREWYKLSLHAWPATNRTGFLSELEESVRGTPEGSERRAAMPSDTAKSKLLVFLGNLASKHSPK